MEVKVDVQVVHHTSTPTFLSLRLCFFLSIFQGIGGISITQ